MNGNNLLGQNNVFNNESIKTLPLEIVNIWRKYDTNLTGSLNIDALSFIILDMGISIPSIQLVSLYDEIDTDKSGQITLDEFTNAYNSILGGYHVISLLKKKITEIETIDFVKLLEFWKRYDINNTGTLEMFEVSRLFQDIGIPQSNNQIQLLITCLDKNETGQLEFDEFYKIFLESKSSTLNEDSAVNASLINRIIEQRNNNSFYTTDSQLQLDKAIRIKYIFENYLSIYVFIYIIFFFTMTLYRISELSYFRPPLIYSFIYLIFDFLIYFQWFLFKVLVFPVNDRGQMTIDKNKRLSILKYTVSFWVDIIVLIPLDIIFIALYYTSYNLINPDYLRINKVLSIYHYSYFFNLWIKKITKRFDRALQYIVLFLLVAHIFSCSLIFTIHTFGINSVIDIVEDRNFLNQHKYPRSIYWGLTTLAGQVRGTLVPNNDIGLYLLLICSLISLFMVATVLGATGIVFLVESPESRYLDKINSIRSYFSHVPSAKNNESQVIAYYQHLYTTTGTIDEKINLLEELPLELSVPITIEMGKKMLEKVPFFAPVINNQSFVFAITSKLKEEVFEANSIMITKGEVGASMYFLTYGQCEVISDTEPEPSIVHVFEPGDFFGEIALLHNTKRTSTISVSKKSFVNVYILNKNDFEEVSSVYPECFAFIYKAAEERINKIKK